MVTSRRVICRTAVAAAVAGLAVSSQYTSAADVVVLEHPRSLEIQYMSGGTVAAGGTQYKVGQAQMATGMCIGYQGNFNSTTVPLSGGDPVNGGIQSLMFFQVPAIPAGQQLSSVSFAFGEQTVTNSLPDYNVDLYAVGFDKNAVPVNDDPPYNTSGIVSTRIAPAYYYLPNTNADVQGGAIKITNTNGTVTTDTGPGAMSITRIQDNILMPADWTATQAAGAPTAHGTDATGNAALLAFVNGLYARPDFSAGNYLILRMNQDQKFVSGTMRYQIPYNDVLAPTNAITPQLKFTFSPASLPGDADGDGDVDGSDFVIWSNNVGQPSSAPFYDDGDFDLDGDVDGGDFVIWSDHVGQSQSPGALAALTSIPEPATASLLALASAFLLTPRRRRR